MKVCSGFQRQKLRIEWGHSSDYIVATTQMLMLASETGDFGLHNSGPREIQEKQALKLEVSCDENNDNDNNTSGRGE